MKSSKFLTFSLLLLIVLGILDTVYLTWEHFADYVPPCPTHSVLGSWVDCGRVLRSSYSVVLGIPLALYGLAYYLFLLPVVLWKPRWLIFVTPLGLIASLYLLYLQLFVLHAICLYCIFSAAINLLLLLLAFVSQINSQEAAEDAAQDPPQR